MSASSAGFGTPLPANYRWIVLSNTRIGMLLATVNASILLIALPDIFRGIHIDPLAPGNTNYRLWMISFHIVTASCSTRPAWGSTSLSRSSPRRRALRFGIPSMNGPER